MSVQRSKGVGAIVRHGDARPETLGAFPTEMRTLAYRCNAGQRFAGATPTSRSPSP